MEVIFDVDGSSLDNGHIDAQAGWGAVVRVNDAVAEARDALCASCDPGAQTSNRSELRAAQWALHFVHELAKIGHPSGRCRNQRGQRGRARRNALNDDRPVDPTFIKCKIRTDSLYVIRGMQGHTARKKHQDIWQEMDNCSGCMINKGMQIEFEHVRAHTGDEWNERADALAKSAAAGEGHADKFSRCVSCDLDFEDGFVSAAAHFKDVHLDPTFEVEEETTVLSLQEDEFHCELCPRVLADRFALDQHMLDKHGR